MKTFALISLIKDGKIEDAIDSYEVLLEDLSTLILEYKDEILLLRSEYNRTARNRASGTLMESEYNVYLNKTTQNLIDKITVLETTFEPEVKIENEKVEKTLGKTEELRKIADEKLDEKGYRIVGTIYSELSSIFFKARKKSVYNSNSYVVQLMNEYQIGEVEMAYDDNLLQFFSSQQEPFVRIIDHEHKQPCFIIRDYVNGIDLNNLIESKIKLSLIDSLNASITIAEGLHEMHRSKITYKNFIPSQIIMDIEGKVKILPMNIFQTTREIVTWKHLKNSVKYMSPEQLIQAGKKNVAIKLNPRSNQYSLGLIIYYMMEGVSIFEGKGLAALYEDRIDNKETIGELRDFIDSFHQKLANYSIPKETMDTLGSDFIETFNRLLRFEPADRFKNMKKFITEINAIQGQLEKIRSDFGDDDLLMVQESFENVISFKEEAIKEFYNKVLEQITTRPSFENPDRDILCYYSLKYLFNSISSLDHEEGLKEAVTCLMKGLHTDIDVSEFVIFFETLKEVIKDNSDDWNDKIDLSWDTFNQKVLDMIDEVFPLRNGS